MSDWDTLSVNDQQERLRDLAASVLPQWGLDATLRLIKQRENAVFEVTTTDAERYALRVHRAGYHTDAELASEMQWIDALRDYGLAVPGIVPTRDGKRFIHASSAQIPQSRQIDLIAWCDGEQLGSVEEGLPKDLGEVSAIFETIGQSIAAMHNQATSWKVPAGFIRHHWDHDGLVGPEPFWGKFWELASLTEQQRSLIGQARDRVSQSLKAIGKSPQTYSMIHADCVPENILIEGSTPHIIDFDDAGFGWHMFDLATALYFIQDDAGYPLAKKALLKGYRSKRELSEQMLEQLPLFFTARSFTFLGWVHTRQKTETAQEMTPILVQMCCAAAERLLSEDG